MSKISFSAENFLCQLFRSLPTLSFENIVGKGENAHLFPQGFLSYKRQVTLDLFEQALMCLSANPSNSDDSKILSFCNKLDKHGGQCLHRLSLLCTKLMRNNRD